MIKRLLNKHKGFTIVELMIATAIFGVILLIAAVVMIQVGKTYSKGINMTQTQNAARSTLDDVSQAIQFTGGSLVTPSPAAIAGVPGAKYFCTQEKRYIYVPYIQLKDGVAGQDHVFVSDDDGIASPGHCAPPPTSWMGGPNAVELFRQGMRLAKFSLTQVASTNLYNVSIKVIYGDDDLVCDTVQGNCNNNTPTNYALNPTSLTCKTQIGSEFCGVADLSTSVEKRL